VSRLQRMFESHRDPAGPNGDEARRCIEACAECAQMCTVCADACLAEPHVTALVTCVRLNLDCADVCHVTGTLMARPSHRDAPALRAQLQACVEICRACADECAAHADAHEHCRICADACRECVAACEAMIGALVP
jgi:hypothetical protein